MEKVVQLVYTVAIASYQRFWDSSVGISDERVGRSFGFPKESLEHYMKDQHLREVCHHQLNGLPKVESRVVHPRSSYARVSLGPKQDQCSLTAMIIQCW